MVVDASALVAVLLEEPSAPVLLARLRNAAEPALMSAVNLAETVIIIRTRKGLTEEDLRRRLAQTPIQIISVDEPQAILAAETRHKFGKLHLGDCFCYALAKRRDEPVLTLDADFAKTDAALVPLTTDDDGE